MPLISSFDLKFYLMLKKGIMRYWRRFNIENMEMAQAVIKAGEETNSPFNHSTHLQLKICTSFTFLCDCEIDSRKFKNSCRATFRPRGFILSVVAKQSEPYTSVMIDGSKLPFDENVILTQKVVEVASNLSIPVEAELGTIGGKEDSLVTLDKDALYTNPDQAKEFVDRTRV